MDTSTIIWIIVGIVIVIAIIVIIAVLMTSRRRREAHVESERRKAAELREDANQTDLARREREAEAARATAAAKQAEADAKQAQLESDRLARESASHQADAQQLRSDVDERLQKADEVDPDVHTDEGRHTASDDTVRDDRDATARDDRDATAPDDRDVTARERPIDPATPRRDETGRQIRRARPGRRTPRRPGASARLGSPLDEDTHLVDEFGHRPLDDESRCDDRDRNGRNVRGGSSKRCTPGTDLLRRGDVRDAAEAHPGVRGGAHGTVLS